MSISLAKIPGLTPDDAQIKEARLFGDVPGTLYLGSIRVVADDAPITIEPISDQPVYSPRRAGSLSSRGERRNHAPEDLVGLGRLGRHSGRVAGSGADSRLLSWQPRLCRDGYSQRCLWHQGFGEAHLQGSRLAVEFLWDSLKESRRDFAAALISGAAINRVAASASSSPFLSLLGDCRFSPQYLKSVAAALQPVLPPLRSRLSRSLTTPPGFPRWTRCSATDWHRPEPLPPVRGIAAPNR